MANRLIVAVFLGLLVGALFACGGDDTADQDSNDWNIGEDAGLDDAENNGGADANDADPDADPDADEPPPEGVVPEVLIGEPWYGVIRVTDDPAITGLYLAIEFVDDDTVLIHSDTPRAGEWTILDSEDVLLHDLEPTDNPQDPDQFMLLSDVEDDQLVALELSVPAQQIEPYRARFERHAPADIPYDEIAGRWQSTEMLTNEEGNSFPLALRLGSDEIVELGVVGQNNNFFGFTSGQGYTQTFDTGHTFWAMVQDANTEGHPVAGEVIGDGEERRIYMFTETHEDGPGGQPEAEVRAFELQQVDQFAYE